MRENVIKPQKAVAAVARYLLAEYLRSRRFVAPLLLLAAGVVVLYAQPPNAVLSTAGTVAGFVFVDTCWVALALLNTQGDADRTCSPSPPVPPWLRARPAARTRRAHGSRLANLTNVSRHGAGQPTFQHRDANHDA